MTTPGRSRAGSSVPPGERKTGAGSRLPRGGSVTAAGTRVQREDRGETGIPLSPLGERGAVAAEFAVTLPAVLIVLALGVGVLSTAMTTLRLQQAATEGARLLGRGDDAGASAALAAAGGSMTVVRGDGLVCVSTSATRSIPIALPLPPAEARACALDGGR